MSELVVIGYKSEAEAEAAREELLAMAKEYLVDVSDAVVAHANEDGKVKLNQMVNLWALGMSGGAFWGLLIGLLLFNPMLGLVVGAGAGAIGGALSDYGINDDFMKGVAEILKPGQAALFIMVNKYAPDRAIERLAQKGGHILRTNLDTSKEAALREAFEAASKEINQSEDA